MVILVSGLICRVVLLQAWVGLWALEGMLKRYASKREALALGVVGFSHIIL